MYDDHSEAEQRASVVREARTWLRTPWRHNQALKGVGVDCGRLLIEVYRDAGVIPGFDPGNYSRQWNLHRAEEVYLAHVQAHAREITRAEARAGDCLIFLFGKTWSHAGIIAPEPPWFIHAYVRTGVILGNWETEGQMGKAPPRFFSPWSANGR